MKIAVCFGLILFTAGNLLAQLTRTSQPVSLFNGKNLDGFTFCLNGQADPLKTWSVTNGLIHCTGQPAGYLRTTSRFSNYVLTVEWRFVKVAPKADNTGILLHIQTPDKVWPRCVQVQGKHTRQGDLFLMAGAESKEHQGKDANTPLPFHGESAERPVGKWNVAKTICRGATIESYLNGRWMNATTDCTVTNGFIGIQSEGGEIEIRKMEIAPLNSP